MNRKLNLSLLQGVGWMRESKREIAVLLSGACLLLMLMSLFLDQVVQEEEAPMPDFASISSIPERKKAFFEYMLPFVEKANYRILEQRDEIGRLEEAYSQRGTLNGSERARIDAFLDEYRFEPVETLTEETFRDLLSRVDEIPPSLALSQAALESAWGSSRFAQEGNNLFGMWCYEPDCGIVPRKRPPSKTYEVAKYASSKESFDAYFRNLNTSRHYLEFRILRRSLRAKGIPLSGIDLAEGLNRYSQEGYAYISKVQGLIRSNRLDRFD